MLMRIWIIAITAIVVACELNGKHICQTEERYPVNVTEYTWQNVTVRSYKWCMGFPPRCSFYSFKTVKVPRLVETYGIRTVRSCCKGYAPAANGEECILCQKCLEGHCGVGGLCSCNPGFQGADCSDACTSMRWGPDCKFDCLCERGSCNPRTGRCDCPSGWFGTRCEVLCLEGFYGKHCIHRCRCGERDLCNPETGECIKKTTKTQEHHSTRAIHYPSQGQTEHKHTFTPSLKKYHTFDMDLISTKPPIPNKPIKTEQKSTKSTGKAINVYNNNIPTTKYYTITNKIYNSNVAGHSNQNKNLGISRRLGTERITTSREDSLESTTEMNFDIKIKKEENYLFLNEYGSLEKKDRKGLEEYSSEIQNAIFRHNKTLKNASDKTLLKKIKELNVSSERKNNSKFSSNKKLTNEASYNKPTKNKKPLVNHSEIHRSSGEESHKNQNTFKLSNNKTKEINLPVKPSSKLPKTATNKSKTSTDSHHRQYITQRKTIKWNTTPSPTLEMSTYKNQILFTTLPSKEKPLLKTTSEGTVQIEKTPEILKQTPSIPIHGKSVERQRQDENIEEDELQKLDRSNILTSRETSTPLNVVGVMAETVTPGRKGFIPFTEVLPSTRNFNGNIENEIQGGESAEHKNYAKEVFDYHQQREKTSVENEVSGEFDYSTTEKSNLAEHMSIAALISFLLVMIISTIFAVHHYARKRRRRGSKNKSEFQKYSKAVPTVSVYTHSIFHTPLPDPPSAENPVFSPSAENSNDHRTFQTHVVCSLNFPKNHHLDDKDYTYDHPPSTGSYRAASIPEPPDISEINTNVEPVYDEIPLNVRTNSSTSPPPSYKSSCIYVNTCGKTRF